MPLKGKFVNEARWSNPYEIYHISIYVSSDLIQKDNLLLAKVVLECMKVNLQLFKKFIDVLTRLAYKF